MIVPFTIFFKSSTVSITLFSSSLMLSISVYVSFNRCVVCAKSAFVAKNVQHFEFSEIRFRIFFKLRLIYFSALWRKLRWARNGHPKNLISIDLRNQTNVYCRRPFRWSFGEAVARCNGRKSKGWSRALAYERWPLKRRPTRRQIP